MSKVDPRKLKDEAAEAVSKGKWRAALERYLALERLEPRDGSWPQRAGEMSRRLGRGDDAITLLDRAADVFAHGGFLLKAIAVCKIILEIDNEHTQTQAKLAQFYAARGLVPPAPRTPGLVPTAMPAASARPAKVITGSVPAIPQPAKAAPAAPPAKAVPPARRAPVEPPPAPRAPTPPRAPVMPPRPAPVHAEDDDWSDVLEEDEPTIPGAASASALEPELELDTDTAGGIEPRGVDAGATELEVTPDLELDLDPPATRVEPAARASHTPAPPPPPADALARKLPQGAPLAEMSLGHSVPGARASQDFPSPNVFEIPLEEEGFDVAFESSVGGATALPAESAPPAPEPSTPAAEAARAIAPRTPLFSALDEFRLRLLIERVRFLRIDVGQTLFRRGDPADCLYVVAQGEVAVLGERDVEIARLGEGSFFGEIALLTNQPRNATIRATVETDLLALDRDMIGDLVSNSPAFVKVLLRFMRDRLLSSLIGSSPLFAPFSGEERVQLVGKFRFLEVEAGAQLVEQGKRSPGLFILLAGKVTAFLDGKPIVDLGPGDLIGEMSLLTRGSAIASVRATSKAYLLDLPRADFQEVIMTHPQVLEFVNQLADDRRKQIEAILAGKATYGEGHVPVVG